MGNIKIEKGWMNAVWNLDDGIVLKITVRDLKEMIIDTHKSSIGDEE